MDHCFVHVSVTLDSGRNKRGTELQDSEARAHAARVAHHRRRIRGAEVKPKPKSPGHQQRDGRKWEEVRDKAKDQREEDDDQNILDRNINGQPASHSHTTDSRILHPRPSHVRAGHHHHNPSSPTSNKQRSILLHRTKRRPPSLTVPILIETSVASPRDALSQFKRDPFNNDRVRDLPGVMHDLMEYAYETMWPNNMPGLDKSIVKAEMISRRRLALESQLDLHCQVSNMSSLAFNLAHYDPRTLETINQLRMIHQNLAIPLLRAEIAALNGRPPSEALLQRVVLLDTQGAAPVDNWAVHIHPNSPILAGTNVKSYYRFRPSGGSQGMGGKAKLFRFLVQELGGIQNISPGLARRLYLFDVSDATAELTRPIFPLVPELIPLRELDLDLDEEAIALRATLGSGFKASIQDILDEDSELAAVVAEACRLTVVLDQYKRSRHLDSPAYTTVLSDLNFASLRLQHQLYTIPSCLDLEGSNGTDMGEDDRRTKREVDAYLLEALRLAMMVYTDMVLYPLPWPVGIKPRLAKHLRSTLTAILDLLGPPSASSPPPSHPNSSRRLSRQIPSPPQTSRSDFILWLLLMGGIAATFTPHRTWFVEKVDTYADALRCVSFVDFTAVVRRFMWWECLFDEPAAGLWEEKKLWASTVRLSSSPSATQGSSPESPSSSAGPYAFWGAI